MVTATLEALGTQLGVLLELLDELTPGDWERPTRCPPMTVLDLTGHLVEVAERTRALAEADASGREPNTDRARWWVMPDRRPPADIVAQAQKAAAGLGPDTARETLARTAEAMMSSLGAVAPDAVVGTDWRTMRADELAGSRVLEFGVHTMDLGHATLRGERIDPSAASIVADILDTLLGAALPQSMGWDRKTYILTGTGRRDLTPNEVHTLGPLAERFPLVT